VANSVAPDTLKMDPSQPAGFPNGRRRIDPVIDTEVAWLSLDLTKHPSGALAEPPLGPEANDIPLAPGGSTFNFRTGAPSAHVQVDRTRQPAVATALIRSTLAVLANAPQDDVAKANLAICARAVRS